MASFALHFYHGFEWVVFQVGIPDGEDDAAPYTPYQSEEGEAGPSGSMVNQSHIMPRGDSFGCKY